MLTSQKITQIRHSLEVALATVAREHGLNEIKIGNITYHDLTFTAKIEGIAPGGLTKEEQMYQVCQPFMGLPPLGSEVTISGKMHKTTGMNSTRTKVHLTEVSSGKAYVAPVPIVLEAYSKTQIGQPGSGAAAKPAMPLVEFIKAVNELDKAKCDRMNTNSKSLFKAMHHPMPESMLALYHNQGLTPEETLERMGREVEAEGRAEARAS